LTIRIEWQTRTQIHRAGDTAFDHIGRLILVGIGAVEQFRRDIVEVQATTGIRRERVAPVQLGTHLCQAADEYVRRLTRWVGAVVIGLQPIDADTRNMLQSVRY